MSFTRNAPFIAGLAAISLMGFGCNPFQSAQDKISEKIGQSVVEGMVDKASDGKVKVDADKNQMMFRDNKTGDMMAFGEDVQLPEDFPKDIPLYPGTKVVGVTISKQTDKGTSVTLKTSDAIAKVMTWYADKMKSAGFTEDSSMTAGGTEIRSYSKGSLKIALTISSDGSETSGTVITVIRTETAAEAQ